jgi:UDP-N-acetylmuramate: L-alanyl-gamma-D-glutamyl-meso-diaminopimelate ligase
VIGYGETTGLDWSITEIKMDGGATDFSVRRTGALYGRFRSSMPGRHNALNALAVIAVLDGLGVGPAVVEQALASFQGVRRRQEVRGEAHGITVIDDFAHHPTAVRETLAALKEAYRGRRLVAVFEPRTNSSRRNVFQQDYVLSFDAADIAIVREPPGLEKIPVAERFSSERLVADLGARGIAARYAATTDEILAFLAANSRPGDVIAILSNGGFDNIHERLLALLRASAPAVSVHSDSLAISVNRQL